MYAYLVYQNRKQKYEISSTKINLRMYKGSTTKLYLKKKIRKYSSILLQCKTSTTHTYDEVKSIKIYLAT